MPANKTITRVNGFQPVLLEQERVNLLIVGGGSAALKQLQLLHKPASLRSVTVVGPGMTSGVKKFGDKYANFIILEKDFDNNDLEEKNLVIAAADDPLLD